MHPSIAIVSIVQSLTTLALGAGIVGTIGAVYSFLRYSSYKNTVNFQNDQIKALKGLLQTHELQLAEQGKEIARLSARNEALETVPLQQILKSLDSIQKVTVQILSNQTPNGNS